VIGDGWITEGGGRINGPDGPDECAWEDKKADGPDVRVGNRMAGFRLTIMIERLGTAELSQGELTWKAGMKAIWVDIWIARRIARIVVETHIIIFIGRGFPRGSRTGTESALAESTWGRLGVTLIQYNSKPGN